MRSWYFFTKVVASVAVKSQEVQAVVSEPTFGPQRKENLTPRIEEPKLIKRV